MNINEDWSLLLICVETLIIIVESGIIFRLKKSRAELMSREALPSHENVSGQDEDTSAAPTPSAPVADTAAPAESMTPPPDEAPATDARTSDTTDKKRAVLLVEKDPTLQSVYTMMLRQQYMATVISDLADAIPIAASGVVDCMVVSQSASAGNQDYREYIRRIKDSDPMEKVKIIFLTAGSSDTQTAKHYQEGIDLILHKPVTPAELHKGIERLYGDLPISALPPYRHLAGKRYSNGERRFLNQLTDLLENNHECDTNGIGLIARQLALSHSSLYKKLKSLTGLSVIEFSSALKICKALRLMENGMDNVNAIGAESGFHEVKSFRNTFKSIMGMPPSAYIRQLSPSAAAEPPGGVTEALDRHIT